MNCDSGLVRLTTPFFALHRKKKNCRYFPSTLPFRVYFFKRPLLESVVGVARHEGQLGGLRMKRHAFSFLLMKQSFGGLQSKRVKNDSVVSLEFLANRSLTSSYCQGPSTVPKRQNTSFMPCLSPSMHLSPIPN